MRASAIRATVTVLLVAVGLGAISAGAGAQDADGDADGAGAEGEAGVEVRIVAQRLAGGRTEFGLQRLGEDGRWGALLLPGRRFFPAEVEVGRWLSSSPLSLNEAATAEGGAAASIELRIVAQRSADGRIEFGLQQRGADGEWGERLLPARRFFPTEVEVGRWLSSAPVVVTEPEPPGESVGAGTPDEGGQSTSDGGPDQGGEGSGEHVAEAAPSPSESTPGGGERGGHTPIAASHGRTCAVRTDGGVACWGREHVTDRVSTADLEDVVSVSFEWRSHTCVLHGNGTVSCWGGGGHGQLGQGNTTDHNAPVEVPGIADAVAVAAGSLHACVAHADGEVSCWGSGSLGQLGDGTLESSSSPRRVPGLEDVVALSAGSHSNCAVHHDGTLSCWGWGAAGSTNYESPKKIQGLRDVDSVTIGRGRICAVTAGGRLYCWPFSEPAHPVLVENIDDAAAVSVGRGSVCVLHRDAGVSCWGEKNSVGQLGNGTTTSQPEPVRIDDINDAVAITVSKSLHSLPFLEAGAHACVMHEDGSVSCWGSNEFGQLGDSTYETRLSPTRVRRFDRIETDLTLMLRAWVDLVIVELEEDHPWLRVAWDHIGYRSFVVSNDEYAGAAFPTCSVKDGRYTCRTFAMYVEDIALELGVVVHELAHIYDLTTSLTPDRAWGAVQLYFATTYPDCFTVSEGLRAGVEILADTMKHLVLPNAWLSYYNSSAWPSSFADRFDSPDCPSLPKEPTREAEAIVRTGLAGEVPDWYTENFTTGEELWDAMRNAPNEFAFANLADEFGGVCTTDWLTYPLIPSIFPAAGTNPFC